MLSDISQATIFLSTSYLPPSLSPSLLPELYNRGLIYFDIPIADADIIVVPPLQGFVMNRVQGDYFETLLYKIFVSIDEHTSVAELANVLQVDISLIKVGVAKSLVVFERLGLLNLRCGGMWVCYKLLAYRSANQLGLTCR